MALATRRLSRDLYDFWWVVLQTEGGPAAAAAAMRQPGLSDHLGRQYQAVMALVGDALASGDGPATYAESMLRLGSADDYDTLMQDVLSAGVILHREIATRSAL